ncbi:MAG: lipoprotein [Pseudomonadota bacterium]|nr:lipoprotein [Pseudomonadota bacterium]
MRLFSLLLFLMLTACGQKGPLYFAPQEPEPDAPAKASATPADDNEQDETQD